MKMAKQTMFSCFVGAQLRIYLGYLQNIKGECYKVKSRSPPQNPSRSPPKTNIMEIVVDVYTSGTTRISQPLLMDRRNISFESYTFSSISELPA